MKSLTIGQVAHRTGIGVETIRFYEREGLIPKPPRRPSGYRQYPEQVVDLIRFTLRAKELGFSLKEIRELLSLQFDPEAKCEDVRQRAEAKIRTIDEKIEQLSRMRRALESLTTTCHGEGVLEQCPILRALRDAD